MDQRETSRKQTEDRRKTELSTMLLSRMRNLAENRPKEVLGVAPIFVMGVNLFVPA